MRPFRRTRDGTLRARFEPDEAEILARLAAETAELAVDAASGAGDPREDPAFIRLLPDAYSGDAEASAEFRRFTAGGLAERKALTAQVVMETLGGGSGAIEVRLDAPQAAAWLRTLTDIRLVLAARLGIVQDGDEGDIHDADSAFRRAVYDWLAGVQESLVLALRSTR
ncbi:hypothetical protein ATY41_05950 [Leifsonia xyli subsp. xyli]|uniref:Uncharacterized protein n=2 Tax=Leifsonia xyli subsp. xyli TaxID=59736 RepID=Q6AEN1_LEIXX|nr:DUF2017 domain-containing protein [Leifsonia xyli]AAT89165.1 conserved hypothetical protein [Leifsonia xyli subsp. xyli str. CTCB07]ODA89444.1 hypothetical protein ATY41_05950 [Leifsonia xyli subsp. xyli]